MYMEVRSARPQLEYMRTYRNILPVPVLGVYSLGLWARVYFSVSVSTARVYFSWLPKILEQGRFGPKLREVLVLGKPRGVKRVVLYTGTNYRHTNEIA